jgi:hypothetical protein
MSFFDKLRGLKHLKVMPIVRVSAYLLFVGGAVTGWATHEAKASIGEQSFILGRDLSKVADLLDHTYELRINGQTAYMAENESSLPLTEILDRYESVCRDNPGIVAEAWKGLPEKVINGTGKNSGLVAKLGVIRKENPGEGMVVCLARSDVESESSKVAFQKFLKSGELSFIGKLRYVYVAGPSPSGRYTVTTLWTENNFNINQIMPPEDDSDAPGTDSPTVGRPPSGKRVFSASITGAPYAIRMYESKVAPEFVYSKFDKSMTSDGWLMFSAENDAHVYIKDGIETMVSAVRDPNSKTVVTISELGGDQLRQLQ